MEFTVSDIVLIVFTSLFFLFCTGYLCIIVHVIRKVDRRHREYLFLDSSELFEDLRTRSEDKAAGLQRNEVEHRNETERGERQDKLEEDNSGIQYVPSD